MLIRKLDDNGTVDLSNIEQQTRLTVFDGGYSKHLFNLRPDSLGNVFTDKNGNIYMYYSYGRLYLFCPYTETTFCLTEKSSYCSYGFVDRENRIWLIGGRQVGLYNKTSCGIYVTYRSNKAIETIASTGAFEGSSGNIWIPTYSGISELNIETGKIRKVKYSNCKDTGGGIGFKAPDGSCWVSTWGGTLCRFDEETAKTSATDRSMDLLHGFHFIDHHGTVWIGSVHGVGTLDTKTGVITKTDDVVLDRGKAICDKNNNYWITSNQNYGKFDVSTGRFEKMSIQRGDIIDKDKINKIPKFFAKDKCENVWCFF
jgi:ligand-binding sensor domain-containing protein